MSTLKLVWPQWQGAGSSNASLVSDLPSEHARSAYSWGTRILDAMLVTPNAITEHIPVPQTDDPIITHGIESKNVLLQQLRTALETIAHHNPDSILTLGGDCSVSAAPFAAMAEKHGDDLAIVWVDAHPDLDTPETSYEGYHAMVLSHLIGEGDAETLELLPATVDPSRVAIAGIRSWQDDVSPHVTDWGITSFTPDHVRADSEPLITWLKSTDCSKVAIHFDVDVVDSNDLRLGLGAEPDGLILEQASRVVQDVSNTAEVVALTVAEYIPREVIRLVSALSKFPLIG